MAKTESKEITVGGEFEDAPIKLDRACGTVKYFLGDYTSTSDTHKSLIGPNADKIFAYSSDPEGTMRGAVLFTESLNYTMWFEALRRMDRLHIPSRSEFDADPRSPHTKYSILAGMERSYADVVRQMELQITSDNNIPVHGNYLAPNMQRYLPEAAAKVGIPIVRKPEIWTGEKFLSIDSEELSEQERLNWLKIIKGEAIGKTRSYDGHPYYEYNVGLTEPKKHSLQLMDLLIEQMKLAENDNSSLSDFGRRYKLLLSNTNFREVFTDWFSSGIERSLSQLADEGICFSHYIDMNLGIPFQPIIQSRYINPSVRGPFQEITFKPGHIRFLEKLSAKSANIFESRKNAANLSTGTKDLPSNIIYKNIA